MRSAWEEDEQKRCGQKQEGRLDDSRVAETNKYVFDAVLQIEDSRGQCVVLDPDEWPSTFELGTAISRVADALEKAGDFRAETEKLGLNVRSLLRRLRRGADQKPERRLAWIFHAGRRDRGRIGPFKRFPWKKTDF